MKKFVFVTGGVCSGLGKGITAASLGRLLKQRGLTVTAQKLDPYINVDPGTMNPLQHGEVFVTDDGAETDLDLGHYERFVDVSLTQFSNLTSGKVYWNVLNREREGHYLGQTVQVIPHITSEIKNFVYKGIADNDVLITEIGGTTGDIESQPFLEALRQISIEVGSENCVFIHVTLVPFLKGSEEHKSKPTQHSVKELRSMGISPNIIVTRADEPIESSILDKIALFCNVRRECVIENLTLDSLYSAPLALHENKLDEVVCQELNINPPVADLTEWCEMTEKIKNRPNTKTIGIVGKYVELHDAYLSIIESLNHSGYETGSKVKIKWIDSETITETNVAENFSDIDGVIIPGGFGDRGIEGKINACKYARENNVPYLGICLGMQIAVIEYARNVCGLQDANSAEFDINSKNKVIDYMPEQLTITQKGGTMRLGAYPCKIMDNSLMKTLYGANEISERHRHRFEFNNEYRKLLTENGLAITGVSPDEKLVEAVEIPNNKFFVGVQFHPEFKSRPNKPHPLFVGLLKATQKQ